MDRTINKKEKSIEYDGFSVSTTCSGEWPSIHHFTILKIYEKERKVLVKMEGIDRPFKMDCIP